MVDQAFDNFQSNRRQLRKLWVMSGALVALRDFCVLRRGQDVPSFPRTPFLASGALPPLRSGQVSLDEAEHFLHNRDASAPMVFGIIPECRSASLRN